MNPIVNRLLLTRRKHPIYGVWWNKGSSPTLTRTDAAAGMVAAAGIDAGLVRNDFDGAEIFREMQPWTDSLGNVFIRIPRCYIRKTDGVGFKTWQISKGRHGADWYLPWCFYDFTNGRELPYVDVGAYKGSSEVIGATTRLRSVSGVYPLINAHIVAFRTFARNNNTGGLAGYQQLDIHTYDLLQTLLFVEFATLDIQTVMQGYTTGQYLATHTATVAESSVNRIIVANAHADLYRVGQAISVGTTLGGNQIFYGRTITAIDVYDASNKAISFDGAAVNIAVGNILYNTGWKNGFSAGIAASSGCIVANDGKYPWSYRGIESPYGDIWQWVDGVNINNHRAWVARDAADYASNVFAHPYLELAYSNATSDGYIVAMGHDPALPFAEFPVNVTGGGSATFYADYYWQNTGQLVARVGGRWNDGADAGASSRNLSTVSSSTHVTFGGRLVRKAVQS